MKAGIVGLGAVGSATAMAIALRAQIQELVLVNRNRARARGIATDMRYGMPISAPTRIEDGDYADLAGAGVVVIAAGVNEKAGGATDRADPAGRLRLLEPNVRVFEEIVPRIVGAAPEAVILVATDPPEPLVDAARICAGHERVFGTGTYLDSLRFRVHLAERLQVSPKDVDAYVVGEHGTSSVFLWSSARIGGERVIDILSRRGIDFDQFRQSIEHDVRYANITIIEGIGASQYGIGMVTARMVEAVLRDEHAVMPVGSHSEHYGVTLSLPSVIGRAGVAETLWPVMSNEEETSLLQSIDILQKAVSKYVIRPPRMIAPDLIQAAQRYAVSK
jgi:L-lactate dehydrogenase